MKGDFSRLEYNASDNDTGVMHQQGRVLTDQDWNAADQINRHLRQQLGRDAIGAHVAAVPSEYRDSLKVTGASSDGSVVKVEVNPGQVWVDGLHLIVAPGAPVQATYVTPPSAEANPHDAVILEVWEEMVNAFQFPDQMIEPALGGVDTTERVRLQHRLKLLRLEDNESCHNLSGKLTDDFSTKAKLTVTPAPTLAVAGACPIEMNGGYTGFEHYLYRIEIAEPDSSDNARFVWSRFGGGLVGRGTFKSTGPNKGNITVTANDQMINHCGLTSFYLEAGDSDGNHFSADATLTTDGLLTVTNSSGTWPGSDAFFRLWDGIKPVSDFTAETELELGIQLQLDTAAADNSNYTPGDYWSFPVRAAGATFAVSQWPTNAAPQGVHYHRVPLGILLWDSDPGAGASTAIEIDDCRRVFDPLTQLDSCCTFTVGDGTHSHGDFESIQQAINHLPSAGGRVCVLPGEYRENVDIEKDNIRVHGCGSDSRVVAATNAPVFHIIGASDIKIESLHIEAHPDAEGILIGRSKKDTKRTSSRINLTDLEIKAAKDSAIKAIEARWLTIRDCSILMADVSSPWPGIFTIADDVLMEHNSVRVIATKHIDVEILRVSSGQGVVSAGLGGIQIGGTSERVSLIDNRINGGIGNGVTLGSIEVEGKPGEPLPGTPDDEKCKPCRPGGNSIDPGNGKPESPTYRSAGALYDIRIERNRIEQMGLNGIGVAGFFDLSKQDEFISVVGLDILGNTIHHCLNRPLEVIPEDMTQSMGYGGIALADVEYLIVHDNVIEHNGLDHLEPICGIFVLHGEGVDISRNRILNNGAKTPQSSANAKPGARGGINIIFGIAPTESVEIKGRDFPRQNGVPAIKVHDNIVSHPLGRALSLIALGPISVQGNQFTSRGVVMKLRPVSPSFIASTVLIGNLGMSMELYGQLLFFSGINKGQFYAEAGHSMTNSALVIPKPSLDDKTRGQYMANGNVQFSDNQCVLDLVETGLSLSVSSIFIYSLDDIGFHDNQCDCSLLDDFVLTQSIVLGFSMRASGNRFKEGIANAIYSAVTIGVMNMTTHNQATHCLRILGVAGLVEDSPNTVLLEGFTGDFKCGQLNEFLNAGRD
jgi:hypothetical protein